MCSLRYLTLLLAAAVCVRGQGMFFKVDAIKGYGNHEPVKFLKTYYIPDKQCTGVLKNLTHSCEYLNVVRVKLVDSQPYPEVTIDPLLESVSVRRRAGGRGCVGDVAVHVSVGCGDARRSARSLPDLQVPLSHQLPPISPLPSEPSIVSL